MQLAVAKGGPAVGKRDPKLQPIALFYGAMPAGVAVWRDGRIFVSFPWDGSTHVGEIRDGALAPILPREDSARSIQGMDIDEKNRLWLLDPGAGRLLAMDLKSNQIVKRIELSQDVRKTSFYANDVRVDARRGKDGFAYISDSVGGGVIIVDLGSGESWRRLQHAISARSDDDFVGQVEGEPTSMHGQTDGIALSPDGKTVYYAAFSRRVFYAVSADALADRTLIDEQVEKSIKKIADKTSANDGMCCDAQGRIYTTDYEENAIRRFSPDAGPDQKGEIVVQDERLLWPDAVWVQGEYLYITTNQLNRLPGLHKGKDLRQEPYALFRYPLSKP